MINNSHHLETNAMTMKSKITSLLAIVAIGCYSSAFAQGYDDDDIYYNPSKSKAAKTTETATSGKSYNSMASEFPSADTYTVTPGQGVNIDVDAYNRRGAFAVDTVNARNSRNKPAGNFECTQQIERFYNPRVIIESTDDDVAQYYYAEPDADVNIYINTPGYWGSSIYSPYYYGSPWYWGTPRSWWYYNSWAWNPTWSWGWDPYWSWTWGPSWAWGPTWSWGWGGYYPGYWGPAYHPVRPGWANRPSGNSRPCYRPGGSDRGYGNSRPGYRGGNYYGTSRPSGTSPSYRPGTSGHGSNSSGYRSGRGSNRSSSSPSYRNNSGSNRSSSSPSYRSGSGSYRSSGGSYGGSRGGGSSHGGGGGRGRH